MDKIITNLLHQSTIGDPVVTREGFLVADAKVAKAGVYFYPEFDSSYVLVNRNELIDMTNNLNETKVGIPFCNDHPPEHEGLTSKNAKDYVIGSVSQFRMVGNDMYATITVTDEDTINDIRRGKKEISTGYVSNLLDKKGEFEGKSYSKISRDLKLNHIALVKDARFGSDVRIAASKKDSSKSKEVDNTDMEKDDKKPDENTMDKRMTDMENNMKKVMENMGKMSEKMENMMKGDHEGTGGTDTKDDHSKEAKGQSNAAPESNKGEVMNAVKKELHRHRMFENSLKSIFGENTELLNYDMESVARSALVENKLYTEDDMKLMTNADVITAFHAYAKAKKLHGIGKESQSSSNPDVAASSNGALPEGLIL